MDIDNKTSNLNGSASNSLKRFTPSELRERLLHEQEARIVELGKHNTELTKAMEHEREQARLHTEANAKYLELLEKAIHQQPVSRTSSPAISSITSAAGNLIALAVIAGFWPLLGMFKFLMTSPYPEVNPLLRLQWIAQGGLLVGYFAWIIWAIKTKKTDTLLDYISKAVWGTSCFIALIYQCLETYFSYRFHSLDTTWFGDLFAVTFITVFSYGTYSNWRKALTLWKTSKKPATQSTA